MGVNLTFSSNAELTIFSVDTNLNDAKDVTKMKVYSTRSLGPVKLEFIPVLHWVRDAHKKVVCFAFWSIVKRRTNRTDMPMYISACYKWNVKVGTILTCVFEIVIKVTTVSEKNEKIVAVLVNKTTMTHGDNSHLQLNAKYRQMSSFPV